MLKMYQLTNVPVGIDLGSWTSKVAVAKRGGVEVITNEANFRETPVVVGYGPAERQIGECTTLSTPRRSCTTLTTCCTSATTSSSTHRLRLPRLPRTLKLPYPSTLTPETCTTWPSGEPPSCR